MQKIFLLIILFILTLAESYSAGGWKRDSTNHYTDSLVMIDVFQINPGTSEIIFHFEIKEDWHLYWVNPGDAGLTVSFNWEFPEGTTDTVFSPIPDKKVESDITSFIHEDKLVLIARILSPDFEYERKDDLYNEIDLELNWLICKEKCLPGRASFTLKPYNWIELDQIPVEYLSTVKEQYNNLPMLSHDPISSVEFDDEKVAIVLLDGYKPVDFYPDKQGIYLYDNDINKSENSISVSLDPFRYEEPVYLSGIILYDREEKTPSPRGEKTNPKNNLKYVQINIPLNK